VLTGICSEIKKTTITNVRMYYGSGTVERKC